MDLDESATGSLNRTVMKRFLDNYRYAVLNYAMTNFKILFRRDLEKMTDRQRDRLLRRVEMCLLLHKRQYRIDSIILGLRKTDEKMYERIDYRRLMKYKCELSGTETLYCDTEFLEKIIGRPLKKTDECKD